MHDLHHALRHSDKSIFNSLLIINDHQRRLLEKALNFSGGMSVIVRNSAEIKHCVTFCRTQEEFLNIRIKGRRTYPADQLLSLRIVVQFTDIRFTARRLINRRINFRRIRLLLISCTGQNIRQQFINFCRDEACQGDIKISID